MAAETKGAKRHNAILSDPVLKRVCIVGAIGVLGCVIARAPSILSKLSVPVIGIELGLNAGYILIFGPLLVLLGVIWAALSAGQRRRSSNRPLLF